MTSVKRVMKPALRQFIERVASQDIEEFPEWDLKVETALVTLISSVTSRFTNVGTPAQATHTKGGKYLVQVPRSNGGGREWRGFREVERNCGEVWRKKWRRRETSENVGGIRREPRLLGN